MNQNFTGLGISDEQEVSRENATKVGEDIFSIDWSDKTHCDLILESQKRTEMEDAECGGLTGAR